uniref:ATP synthase subunit delta n=1 Tax=Cyanothece sp. (strain PCC 7425 / ATCC 29141) TaxID=395961 RepID=ATPD_CYAP4|nr:RecName: Full=ATP synthase subunit delta; AltName: Full=ATP synthase F(1) sector subunit delta; AltName: Full=F-type ATPase subunit delta; Short=F-ATPase subunit delta [Cyanothece sp. PCC 7425]
MKQTTVGAEILEPYAEALMSLAQSNNLTGRFGEDVAFILDLLKTSPELQQVLANPFVKPESKKAILRQLVAPQVHDFVLKFLLLLVDRRRIFLLEPICKQFQALLRKLTNTVLAEVTSVVELTEPQRQAVIEKVKTMTGSQQVELETRLDPELIGGVIVKVGSQVLDSSIRGQLRRISNTLTSFT